MLQKLKFPVREVTLLASARGAGERLRFGEESLPVRELTPDEQVAREHDR